MGRREQEATAGAGGKAGAGGNVCPLGGVLDCSTAGALKLPDGHVADFSSPEWNSSTAAWCDADGLRGTVFSYSGASPSAATATVDTTAQNLKLNLTVGATGYAGGGLTFDSCVNASAFTSIQFTAALTAGSLTNCIWQVQLQTQDQRDATATNPSGGTCASNCYRYPAVAGLTFPTATASTYRETYTLFNNPASSTISTPTQVTGVQWQVNSGVNGTGPVPRSSGSTTSSFARPEHLRQPRRGGRRQPGARNERRADVRVLGDSITSSTTSAPGR